MGRFCKFCGNPIEDGQECNCDGAVKERQEKAASSVSESANPVEEAPVNADANSAPEVTKDIEVKANESVSAVNNAPLPAQNAGSTRQAGSSAGKSLNIDVAKILKDALGVTKSFLMNPFEALKSSFAEKDKLSQLVAGGISAFIMFIFFIIMVNYPVFDAYTAFIAT